MKAQIPISHISRQSFIPIPPHKLQRKCACGGTPGPTGECAECRRQPLGLQSKLTVNQPGDKYEQEADQVADQVLRMPEPSLQRQAEPDEEEEEMIQAKSASGQAPTQTPVVNSRRSAIPGPGQSLAPADRAFFESRFGHDFSQVRIHTYEQAAESARAIRARAFTTGPDIIFGAGQYAPGTAAGKQLLAHELTHTIQQGAVNRQPQPAVSHALRLSQGRDVPALQRAPLDIAGIKSDIDAHPDLLTVMKTAAVQLGIPSPPPLFLKGSRSGDVAHAADFPKSAGKPDAKPKTDPKLPVEAHFFNAPTFTKDRALILGGFHGDEKPGYEITDALVQELQKGTAPAGFGLAFHTLIIPRVNPGAIVDELAGVTSYDRRCNRQKVDLNRNLPTGQADSSSDCPNTATAPVQPETEGVVKAIKQFQPHRILSTHAISTPKDAGVYADLNTNRDAQDLACGMAALITDPNLRKGNMRKLTKGLAKDLECNPLYPKDKLGPLKGRSLGAYAPTRSISGQTVPVITLEAPRYGTLIGGTGSRTLETFLRPVRGFLGDPAKLLSFDDQVLLDQIKALSLPQLKLFLTGQDEKALAEKVRKRVNARVGKLNALIDAENKGRAARKQKALPKISATSHLRTFGIPVKGGKPTGRALGGQGRIVFDKFFLTGSMSGGWDSLPGNYWSDPKCPGLSTKDRKKAGCSVDRKKWLNESSAVRLKAILRFSAVPGASRHHWGTEVDFNSVSPADWAAGKPLHELGLWLQQNAHKAGFAQVYVSGRTGGHSDEPWHWSYTPLAVPLLQMYKGKIDTAKDVVPPIIDFFKKRAAAAGKKIPADFEKDLKGIDIMEYVTQIASGL